MQIGRICRIVASYSLLIYVSCGWSKIIAKHDSDIRELQRQQQGEFARYAALSASIDKVDKEQKNNFKLLKSEYHCKNKAALQKFINSCDQGPEYCSPVNLLDALEEMWKPDSVSYSHVLLRLSIKHDLNPATASQIDGLIPAKKIEQIKSMFNGEQLSDMRILISGMPLNVASGEFLLVQKRVEALKDLIATKILTRIDRKHYLDPKILPCGAKNDNERAQNIYEQYIKNYPLDNPRKKDPVEPGPKEPQIIVWVFSIRC